ncbi:hypothetical protein QTP70_001802 [Hemibagrus guttatus]|uniref:MHC class I-like antigen recognition-like domain-containing protein n=1 Tax=Hemibagrus guttatus TaxID=175788 RepID=A0AAE0Q5Z3_9TELE|nr:hypothetical protein QTP70_001802 [Hemibagrus guttatus]
MEHSSVLPRVLVFLVMAFPQVSAVTHSLQYFYTGVTPGINFPEFTAVGQVDGGQFVYYDSNIRGMIGKTEWIQKISVEDPDYWNSETQNLQNSQEIFKDNVATAIFFFFFRLFPSGVATANHLSPPIPIFCILNPCTH